MRATVKQPTIDREAVFQLVSQKNWGEIIKVFKNNNDYEFIYADPILKSFIDQSFINELLGKSSLREDPAYKYYLQDFFMLHSQQKFIFLLSEENFKRLIVKIVEIEDELARAYDYAKFFPDEDACRKAIELFEDSLPKVVKHTQQNEIYVTENKNVSSFDASISLFKSNQEYLFYKAVRDVFPTYLVFPNVALTAILDYNAIKGSLSKEEHDYFFKTLIDCIVIDSENNYKPKYFIELDSPFHDNVQQQQKDVLKDQILAKAGQKLLRVRRMKVKHDEKDFVKLIREVIHSN